MLPPSPSMGRIWTHARRRAYLPPHADEFPQLSRRSVMAANGAPVVLIGPNGAGKTNLLEAISFLSPGRGLRRATLEEVAFTEGDGSWAVAAEVEGAVGLATLGTGIEPPSAERATETRKCRIDREPVSSAAAFADHLAIVWLMPAMDGLFAGPASERRRFLDRLALAIDASHDSRVNALERSLRSRNRLLEQPSPDAALAGRGRARNRGTCDRGRGGAQPTPCAGSRAHWLRSHDDDSLISGRRDRARRMDRGGAARALPRPRSRTATAPCCEPTAAATRPPAARSTGRISATSRHPRGQGDRRRGRFDRRTEGVAHRGLCSLMPA